MNIKIKFNEILGYVQHVSGLPRTHKSQLLFCSRPKQLKSVNGNFYLHQKKVQANVH